MPEVRDRAVLAPEAAGGKKSARGVVPLLLADLARREHRQPEMRPQTSTKQGKSTAHRATHSPTTGRKGGTKVRSRWGKRCSPQGPGIGESRVRSRWRVWLGGRGSQLLNQRLDLLKSDDLAIRGSHGFLPYLALLVGFKDGQGADLGFINRLDFTRCVSGARGHQFAPLRQIGRHLGPAYQPVFSPLLQKGPASRPDFCL